MFVVWCLLYNICLWLLFVGLLPFVVCCWLFIVPRLLFVVVLVVDSFRCVALMVVRCLSFGVLFSVFVAGCLCVVCVLLGV